MHMYTESEREQERTREQSVSLCKLTGGAAHGCVKDSWFLKCPKANLFVHGHVHDRLL